MFHSKLQAFLPALIEPLLSFWFARHRKAWQGAKDGSTIYAYEVDGKGNSLTDFDDPNSETWHAMELALSVQSNEMDSLK